MPRAAGNSGKYELAVIDGAGHPKGRSAELWSVTTVLKALPKFGLDWWGYKLGVKATLEYLQDENVPSDEVADALTDPDRMYDLLKKRRIITPYTELTQAGGRGTDIHDVAERLLTDGVMPPKDSIDESQLPYATALRSWYLERARHLKVIAIEVPVFSLRYGYAGTLDAILHDVDIDLYFLVDFKTSKGIYESHLLQLAAYEYAARERGFVPADANVLKVVVRLGADGSFEVGNSYNTIDDFLCVLQVHELLERMKGTKQNANVVDITSKSTSATAGVR